MRFIYYFAYLFVFLAFYSAIIFTGLKLFKIGKEAAKRYPLIKLTLFAGCLDFFGWYVAYIVMVMFNGWKEINDASLAVWTNFICFDLLHLAFFSLCYLAFRRIIIDKSKRIKLFLLCLIPAAVIETILLYVIL